MTSHMLLCPKAVVVKTTTSKRNLGAGRSALQSGGRCFGAPLRRYTGIDGSRGECVHEVDALVAPVSHLQRLRGTEQ